MDVRAACCGDRDRSCGSGSSPDSFPPFAVSKEFISSGNASRNESRPGNVPVCRLYLADWDGGVRGGETSAVSRCEAICALSDGRLGSRFIQHLLWVWAVVLGDHRTSFLNGFPDSSTEQSHTRSWPGAQIEDRNKRRAGDIERFLGRSINGSGKPNCKERRIPGIGGKDWHGGIGQKRGWKRRQTATGRSREEARRSRVEAEKKAGWKFSGDAGLGGMT
jgi:hypothetical protein